MNNNIILPAAAQALIKDVSLPQQTYSTIAIICH